MSTQVLPSVISFTSSDKMYSKVASTLQNYIGHIHERKNKVLNSIVYYCIN